MIIIVNLDTLTQYKGRIRQSFVKSQELLDLIFDQKGVDVEDCHIDEQLLPYDYIPGTTTTAKSFVGIEVDVPRIINGTVKDIYVSIYISVHKSLMIPAFRVGVRTDLIAYEVDRIMNGNYDFGIGGCEIYSIERFNPQQDFYGRILVYKVKEFNRKQGG